MEIVYIHGQAIHGKQTPEYRAWYHLKQRCDNPNDKEFKNYGKRGIDYCERWHDFQNFFTDMGPRPDGLTLDRRDNDGNYEPGNCRWATQKVQANNKRDRKNQYWFMGYNENTGCWLESNNQRKTARKLELNKESISGCLSNKYKKTHGGWTFQWM